jgi:hypothetical protein
VTIDSPCRPAAGPCDVPELCNGVSNNCPADEFRSLSTNFVCRPANGGCDLSEVCNGTTAECPPDKFAVGIVCRASSLSNTCDVPEMCDGRAACPTDGFMPFNTNCDDGSELTNNDVCDDKGVCSGKCLVNEACNDRNKCTDDSCSMETGRCVFAAIVGCVSVLPPPTPTDCSVDKSFRFDFLAKPKADNAVEVCFFQVTFTPINGTAVVRTFGANDTQQRAVSFGIGDNSADAKIRANTALVMRFPMSWTASLQSIRVSSVGTDTVLAIVSGTPESNRESIAIALQAFDQDPKQTLTSGVWIMANDAGEHLSPPAIATLQAASWSVVHLRGQPFSLDGVTLSRPIDNNLAEWLAVEGGRVTLAGNTTFGAVDAPSGPAGIDATLIGAIVGGVIGGILLLGGMFFLGTWWSRRRRDADVGAKPSERQLETELSESPLPLHSSQPESEAASLQALSSFYPTVASASPQAGAKSPYQSAQIRAPGHDYQMQVPVRGYHTMEMHAGTAAAGYQYHSLEFQSARGPGADGYDDLELSAPNTTTTPYISGSEFNSH